MSTEGDFETSEASVTTIRHIQSPKPLNEVRRYLENSCAKAVEVPAWKRYLRNAIRITLVIIPSAICLCLQTAGNHFFSGGIASWGGSVAISIFNLMLLVVLLATTVSTTEALARRLPCYPKVQNVLPPALDRWLDTNAGYLNGLYDRVSAFNEQLKILQESESFLRTEDEAGYLASLKSVSARRDSLQREVDDWESRMSDDIAPYKEAAESIRTFMADCDRLKRMLEAFDGSAKAPAPTVDVTTLSLAIRSRESLLRRAEELGQPDTSVPPIPVPRLPAARQ